MEFVRQHRKISIIVVAALILVTAFLIANTIKITIFSRKREISIMRLVGASNINIKIPFIFEGFNVSKNLLVLSVNRKDEFAPIKNREGVDSVETAAALYNEFINRS